MGQVAYPPHSLPLAVSLLPSLFPPFLPLTHPSTSLSPHRLVEARSHKIESEEEMKLESNKLAAMTSYLMTLTAMDDQLKTRIHAGGCK